MRRIVIGASRGLGKYITESCNALAVTRTTGIPETSSSDIIIYCAANSLYRTNSEKLYSVTEDNLLLLEQVSRLPHHQFIYLSSIDVYPKVDRLHKESDELFAEDINGGYASFKLVGESLVTSRCQNPVILRPTSLFGSSMRPNNIYRLLTGHEQPLTLSADSEFNCVTYSMMMHAIDFAVSNCATGIYNCAANNTIRLDEIAKLVKYEGAYGSHYYNAGKISNEKIRTIVPEFNTSSSEVISRFFEELNSNKCE